MNAERNKIIVGKSKGETMYVDLDRESGGYPYWNKSIHSAHFFTAEEADQMLSSSDFTTEQKFVSSCVTNEKKEYIRPPRMIRMLCGISTYNPSGSCEIYTAEISVIKVGESKYIDAHIKE